MTEEELLLENQSLQEEIELLEDEIIQLKEQLSKTGYKITAKKSSAFEEMSEQLQQMASITTWIR